MGYKNQIETGAINYGSDNPLSTLERKLLGAGAGIMALPLTAFAKEQGECAIQAAQMMVEDFDFLSSYITAYSGSISVIFGGIALAATLYAGNELVVKPAKNLYHGLKK